MNKDTRPSTCTIDGCERDCYARELCKGHYEQKRRGRPFTPVRAYRTPFWNLVSLSGPGECWEWIGDRTAEGYGKYYVSGRDYAHRMAFEMVKGPIPGGMMIDHVCRNRSCVNPDHLRLATPKQNSENISPQKNNTSGFRGAYFNARSGRWYAQVVHNRRTHNLGTFDTAEEAGAAARKFREQHFTHSIEG